MLYSEVAIENFHSLVEALENLGWPQVFEVRAGKVVASLGPTFELSALFTIDDSDGPKEATVEFTQTGMNAGDVQESLTPGTLRFLRMLRETVLSLVRDGWAIIFTPASQRLARVYWKALANPDVTFSHDILESGTPSFIRRASGDPSSLIQALGIFQGLGWEVSDDRSAKEPSLFGGYFIANPSSGSSRYVVVNDGGEGLVTISFGIEGRSTGIVRRSQIGAEDMRLLRLLAETVKSMVAKGITVGFTPATERLLKFYSSALGKMGLSAVQETRPREEGLPKRMEIRRIAAMDAEGTEARTIAIVERILRESGFKARVSDDHHAEVKATLPGVSSLRAFFYCYADGSVAISFTNTQWDMAYPPRKSQILKGDLRFFRKLRESVQGILSEGIEIEYTPFSQGLARLYSRALEKFAEHYPAETPGAIRWRQAAGRTASITSFLEREGWDEVVSEGGGYATAKSDTASGMTAVFVFDRAAKDVEISFFADDIPEGATRDRVAPGAISFLRILGGTVRSLLRRGWTVRYTPSTERLSRLYQKHFESMGAADQSWRGQPEWRLPRREMQPSASGREPLRPLLAILREAGWDVVDHQDFGHHGIFATTADPEASGMGAAFETHGDSVDIAFGANDITFGMVRKRLAPGVLTLLKRLRKTVLLALRGGWDVTYSPETERLSRLYLKALGGQGEISVGKDYDDEGVVRIRPRRPSPVAAMDSLTGPLAELLPIIRTGEWDKALPFRDVNGDRIGVMQGNQSDPDAKVFYGFFDVNPSDPKKVTVTFRQRGVDQGRVSPRMFGRETIGFLRKLQKVVRSLLRLGYTVSYTASTQKLAGAYARRLSMMGSTLDSGSDRRPGHPVSWISGEEASRRRRKEVARAASEVRNVLVEIGQVEMSLGEYPVLKVLRGRMWAMFLLGVMSQEKGFLDVAFGRNGEKYAQAPDKAMVEAESASFLRGLREAIGKLISIGWKVRYVPSDRRRQRVWEKALGGLGQLEQSGAYVTISPRRESA
jgi:hypothetical protein